MRIAIAAMFMATMATAQAKPAWRLLPFAEGAFVSDGAGFEGDWTVGSGLRWGAGAQGSFYQPKEDSMGWALIVETRAGAMSGDLEGTLESPDGSATGSTIEQSSYTARLQTGPFYRMLGFWAASGGVFGAEWVFSEGETTWYREDYSLLFGLFTEVGSDPWAPAGVRVGGLLGRRGGDQVWDGVYGDGAIADSLEWLREGFAGEAKVEAWRGPVWGQLVLGATQESFRHRSEEGSTGDATNWSIALRLGYRFALGNLEGFR